MYIRHYPPSIVFHHMFIVFFISMAGIGAVVMLTGFPEPGTFSSGVEDEMSHLLLAETFAQGRLTNPPHPLWQHFETQYVLPQPTYTSKYPPALPLMMTLGIVTFDHPFVGVWLGLGLMCASVTWMLHAWTSPRWALVGGTLFTLHLGILSDWTYYYSGGGIPTVIGASMLLGAVRRVVRNPTPAGGWTIGLGLLILSFGRPYEGLALALCVAAVLAWWLFLDRTQPAALKWRRVVLPVAAMMLMTGSMHAIYNKAVTGNAWELPYQRYVAQYREVPNIMIKRPGDPPDTVHVVMKAKWQAEYDYFQYQRSARGLLLATWTKIYAYWMFYIGPALTFPFLLLLLSRWWRGWTLFAVISGGVVIAAVCLNFALQVHYPAPAAPLAYVLIVSGLRRASQLIGARLGAQKAFYIVAGFAIVCETILLLSLLANYMDQRAAPPLWVRQRLDVRDMLLNAPGEDLVIVSVDPKFRPHMDVVYNSPDIDASPIVWARSISEGDDARLMSYFKNRKIWRLHLDSTATQVVMPQPVSPN